MTVKPNQPHLQESSVSSHSKEEIDGAEMFPGMDVSRQCLLVEEAHQKKLPEFGGDAGGISFFAERTSGLE